MLESLINKAAGNLPATLLKNKLNTFSCEHCKFFYEHVFASTLNFNFFDGYSSTSAK